MSPTKPLAWLAAGALLLALGLRLPEVALPGAWLGLLFVLHGWRGMPVRPGLPSLAVALYAMLAVGNRGSLPVRGPAYFALVAAMTVMALAPFVVERWVRARRPGPASTLAFPLTLVAQEFLRSRVPNGPATWGSLAYTQYGNLPLMQLAALTGIWGITFLVAWFASTVDWAWERGFEPGTVRPLAVYAGVLAAVMGAGALRLALAPSPSLTVRAAAVSLPHDLLAPGEMFRIADGRLPVDAAVGARLERLHEWFFTSTEREARAGARVVAWPEMNFLVQADAEPAAIERARALAAREHVYIAMGIGAVRPGAPRPFQNKTVLVDPGGGVAYSYAKSLPVIGWEERVMQRGDRRLPVVPTELGRVSTAICFEGDFPGFTRQVGRGAADFWILPVNDWEAIKRIHLAMAAFRAIENGAPLLRPASFGVSAAFDAYGRLLGATDFFSGASTLVVEIPMGAVPTVYARVGDLFAWLCVAGTAALAVQAAAAARVARAPSGARAVTV